MTTVTNQDELNAQSEEESPQKKPRSLSNLLVRFITGMVFIPFMIILVRLGGWFLTIPLTILMVIATLEFYFMEKTRGIQNNAITGVIACLMVMFSFHYQIALLWQSAVVGIILITFVIEFGRGRIFKDSIFRIMTTVAGTFYIAFPIAFLVGIRSGQSGYHWFFAYIYCTWGNDTFAYLIGNIFGKTKLAPILSPKKTVEGAVGGIIAGAFLPLAVLYQGQVEITLPIVILFIVASFAGTGGDLFESAVKRFFNIKDSHIPGLNILPGHGGVLDRMDSTLWVAPVMYFFLLWIGNMPALI